MFGIKLRRAMLAVLTVAVLGAAAAGIAYATESGGGTINACAKQGTGQLRLDTGTGCLPTERALQWNQVGPPGPQGPPGPSSAAEHFFYRGGANVPNWLPIVSGTWPDIRPNMTKVTTMHLDTGSYVVSAEVMAENDSGQGIVVCLFGNDSLGFSLAQSAVGSAPGFALQQTFTSQTVFALDAPADLTLSCFNAPPNEPAGIPRIGLADIVATKVDSVTSTGES